MSAPAPAALRVDLPALARAAWARRVRLLQVWLAVGVLAAGVAFVLPRWYTSSVTLVPAPKDGLSLDLSGMGAGIGGAALSFGAGPTPQDQLKLVVSSRAVSDSMVRRFDLVRRWNVKRRESARERLAEHTTVTTPREGQVVVAVEAESPVLARDMASAYAALATSESVRLKTSLAAQRRVYLEARLVDMQREIDLAAARVRSFEELHGAYSLPDQAKETMDAAGQLQAQVALLQTELAAARRYFTDQSSEVQQLRDRIGELNRQLGQLARSGGTLILGGRALPAMKQEYLRLTREQMSLTAVSELLRRFYEQARVEEANPVATFSILDDAELPERHSRPKRGLTVALSMALAMALTLGRVYWEETRAASASSRPVATEWVGGVSDRRAA